MGLILEQKVLFLTKYGVVNCYLEDSYDDTPVPLGPICHVNIFPLCPSKLQDSSFRFKLQIQASDSTVDSDFNEGTSKHSQ